MKIKHLIILVFSCLFINLSHAQRQADSLQINLIIKQIEALENDALKKATYFSEFEHDYLERYGQQLYPYIKKEYDGLQKNTSFPLELKFKVIFLMKNTYFIFGEHEKAAELSYNMLEIATQQNDSLMYYYSYSSIADIEVEMGNKESALDFLLMAKKYAQIDKEALAQTYIDLGSLYLGLSKLKLAKEYILQGIEFAKEAEDYFHISYGYSILMDYYTKTDELETALQYYKKVDSIITTSHFLETSRWLGNVTIRAAEIYRDKGELTIAEGFFEQAFNLAEESNDRHNLAYIYNEWSDLERLKGDYPKSLAYLQQHVLLRDSLYSEANVSRINNLKTAHQIKHKDLEIEVSKQKEQYARNQFWLVLIAGVIFIIALVMLALFLKTKLKAARLKGKLISEQNKVSKIKLENLEREVQLKNKKLADLFLHQFEKATLLNDVIETVETSPKKLKKALHEYQDKKQDWINFKAHFDQVHEGFFDKLNALSSDLTPKDIRFCAYIRMNLSSKEIAIMLGISHRTVQGIKGRVRKKIKLDSKDDMVKFLMNL